MRPRRWLRRLRLLAIAGDRALWGEHSAFTDLLCTAALAVGFLYFGSIIVRAAWAWTHGGF